MSKMKIVTLKTDILIIGGGAAGCYAGIIGKKYNKDVDILIVEKAQIERSGCLAAGISALNAYLNPEQTPESFLEYVKQDTEGLVRDDLVYTIAQGVNEVAHNLEQWGVPFLKDEAGNYLAKGSRSVRINGEQIKPILGNKVKESGVKVLNRINITNYIVQNNQIRGALGFGIRNNKFYVLQAKAVICATGGAAGIYRPNNPGKARHKTWYCPFNTGAGYAMGIRAGAEMTTFEMRFIALRAKDVISPTGTLAQRFNAKQINIKNEKYQENYKKNSTPFRLYATIKENQEGRGPCFLDLTHLNEQDSRKLKKSFLNMSPDIVLKWADENIEPHETQVEIYGTEPYIVGGHSQSGYWIDKNRQTTLEGLFAAGDVAGGAPKKYATGCMVEGKIAVLSALKYISKVKTVKIDNKLITKELNRLIKPLKREEGFLPHALEKRLQKIMDEYAGGLSTNYQLQEEKLLIARKLLQKLNQDLPKGKANNQHQLMKLQEVIDKVKVSQVLVEHLLYRKETRWKGYQERIDYPYKNDKDWLKFVNSIYDPDKKKIEIIEREEPVKQI
ncbi:adenylyl-sulfate reductase subunit alpha [Sporohalobacter salinus]|uniref:adenylyl-sulfate reductase subunit alpha n=1 Tax=Sporohalobacter salinus TaxID=1494606 RepID=UPI00195F5B4A|nr:adenylyl-sulfate reductase subunit alpha [Sporohalobacter salinus]MBM7624995.1 adenylylsulfate reductase subunit A [Sporohalobacter salinus]